MKAIRVAPIINKAFIALILAAALTSIAFRNITIMGRDLTYSDIALLSIFTMLFPLFFIRNIGSPSAKTVFRLFSFILFYAFVTTLWVPYTVNYWYIFYQLALTALTISIPYLASTIINDKYINPNKLITNFSIIITLVYLYYIFTTEQGTRLHGYLGGASTIHAIIIPTLAVHIYNVIHKNRRMVSLICAGITISAIFLTESRAGLLSLILLMLLIVFKKFSMKRILIALFLSPLLYIAFNSRISSNDLYSRGFNDPYRSESIQTGMNYALQSAKTFLLGNGYGSIWDWYAYEKGLLPTWTYPQMLTEFGYTMFDSHSVFIGLIAELGLVGTLPFIAILCLVAREFWRSRKANNELRSILLGAIICTFPTLHTELFFFRTWQPSIVWLFFLFTALSLPKGELISAEPSNKSKNRIM